MLRISRSVLLSLAVNLLFPLQTTAQNNGNCPNPNTNGNCDVGAYPQDYGTVYYTPSDSSDIVFYSQAEGACDANSYADVKFYSGSYPGGTFIKDCGCLLLDGNIHTIDCANTPRNSLAAGTYYFEVDLGVYIVADQFTITHSQATSTAATPTTTVTSTTYESATVSTTETDTVTATAAQTTVTTFAATVQSTSTVTPSPVTTTITSTKTYTKTRYAWTLTRTVTTVTAPCSTLATCPRVTKPAHRFMPREDLVNRQEDPASANGDAPLTTTVTPDAVIVTKTVDGGTSTETDTVTTTTTTTVPPTPLTTTAYTGTATVSNTITLAPITSTSTVHTRTHITTTSTRTITWTSKKTTASVCSTRR